MDYLENVGFQFLSLRQRLPVEHSPPMAARTNTVGMPAFFERTSGAAMLVHDTSVLYWPSFLPSSGLRGTSADSKAVACQKLGPVAPARNWNFHRSSEPGCHRTGRLLAVAISPISTAWAE
jgi:hypothetical protein